MRRAAVLTAACAVPVLLAAPAHADGELGLSRDGVHWEDHLVGPLFDADVRWVPGDVRTARFYVRNQAEGTGAMTVDVERVRRVSLIDSGFLDIAVRTADSPWTSLGDGTTDRLFEDDALAAGRPVAVEVRVVMGPDAPNGTMVLSTDLDFRVALRDATVVSPAGAAGPGGPTVVSPGGSVRGGGAAALPDTGSPVAPWMPPLALGLLLTGTWLVVRRRRDDAAGEPVACTDLEERHPLA